MKYTFIINPTSGTGKQKNIEERINKILASSVEYDIIKTEYAGHGYELASKFAGNAEAVIAIGGDGTVLEIGSALINSSTALGIIPTGSGNGLAHNLGIPIDIEKAIKQLKKSKHRVIDTGTINERVFLSTTGVGFDAHIANCFSTFGTRGFLSYVKLIIREFFLYNERTYNLIIDGKEVSKEAFIVCIANSSEYGNGAVISPESTIDDGILDVCFIKKPKLWQYFTFPVRMFTSTLHRSRIMSRISGRDIIVKNHNKIFHVDGDPVIAEEELHVKINPLSLNVLVPA